MSDQKSVLVGGSGSTGSSLLRTIFNRHSAVFSGEELNFFNKVQYFDNWSKAKRKILSRGPWTIPRTDGWFEYSGNALLHPSYLWTPNDLQLLIDDSESLSAFAANFFDRPLRQFGKTIWLEKTPSNCYSFTAFLQAFDSGMIIHMSRDPLEAVCSLVRRGMSPYFASALWLYNTCSALSAAKSDRYLHVRYESLTEKPSEELIRICDFIGLSYENTILQESRFDTGDHLSNEGWRYGRSDKIAKPKPRFDEIGRSTKRAILTALSAMRVSEKHSLIKKMNCTTCEDACAILGYEFNPVIAHRNDLSVLRRAHKWEILRRTIRLSPTMIGNFPISIHSQ